MCHVRRIVLAVLMTFTLASFTAAPASAESAIEPEITANSAIVVDALTGEVLLNHNADDVRAMASLTKLFTAVFALEVTPLDRQMSVEPVDLVGEASMGLVSGETLRFETLLHGMLIPSGNDAASAIARNAGYGSQHRFMEYANQRTRELGLNSTHLVNPHGLDADGHHSSAREIAAMTMYALATQPAVVDAITSSVYTGEGFSLFNTNRLFNVYPGIVGGKTGVTDDAGYCLMQIASRDGQVVITVLLGSTSDAWYADAEALLDFGFATLSLSGRAVGTDRITVNDAQVSSPPIHSAVTDLAVTSVGSGSSIVSAPALIAERPSSPWFWLLLVGTLVPATVVTSMQAQRLMALIAFGPRNPRRVARAAPAPRTARPEHRRGARSAAWETRSFQQIGRETPLANRLDLPEIHTEFPSSISVQRHRHGTSAGRTPPPVPSFVGD